MKKPDKKVLVGVPIVIVLLISLSVLLYATAGGRSTTLPARLVSVSVIQISGFSDVINSSTNAMPEYRFALSPGSTGYVTFEYTSLGNPNSLSPVQVLDKDLASVYDNNATNELSPLYNQSEVEQMNLSGASNSPIRVQSIGLTSGVMNYSLLKNGDINATYRFTAGPDATQGVYLFPIWGMQQSQILTIGNSAYAGPFPAGESA